MPCDESIAEPFDGLDVPRALRVVAEFVAQTNDVTCQPVVPRLTIDSAQRRAEVVIRHQRTGVKHQGVEKLVLIGRQPYLSRTLVNRPI